MICLPTKTKKRINSLDFLRGIAIFGILLINIESFVYPNPWSSWQYGCENSVDQNTRFGSIFLPFFTSGLSILSSSIYSLPPLNWSKAKNMGELINTEGDELCPFVTQDGKYFFYTSNEDIYWVDAAIIHQLKGNQ